MCECFYIRDIIADAGRVGYTCLYFHRKIITDTEVTQMIVYHIFLLFKDRIGSIMAYHGELVAAHPYLDIIFFENFLNGIGKCLYCLVTKGMTESVINLFQVIKIHTHNEYAAFILIIEPGKELRISETVI